MIKARETERYHPDSIWRIIPIGIQVLLGKKKTPLWEVIRKTWDVLHSWRAQRFLAWLIALTLIAADIALVGEHALARY